MWVGPIITTDVKIYFPVDLSLFLYPYPFLYITGPHPQQIGLIKISVFSVLIVRIFLLI